MQIYVTWPKLMQFKPILQIKLQKQHLLDALDEVMIGREKKERMMTENELFRVAHHEAGHAFMGYILLNAAIPFKLVLFQEVKLLLVLVNKKLKIKNCIQSKILWLI